MNNNIPTVQSEPSTFASLLFDYVFSKNSWPQCHLADWNTIWWYFALIRMLFISSIFLSTWYVIWNVVQTKNILIMELKAIHYTRLDNVLHKFIILEKRVKNIPGFKPVISRWEAHCAYHYTKATCWFQMQILTI